MTEPTTKPAEKARWHWMDSYRGLAVLLVAFGHTAGVTTHVDLELNIPGMDEFWAFFRPVRMPLMFFLSGTLLERSLRKGMRTYAEGKIRRVLWPYLVWSIILLVACADPTWWLDPEVWTRGPVHMWFLRTLLVVYLVAPLMLWISPWVLVIASVALTTIVAPAPDDRLIGLAIFWPGMVFLGAAMAPHFKRIQNLGWWLPVLAGLAALTICVHSVLDDATVSYDYPLSIFTPVLAFLALIWLGPRLPRMKALEFAGRRSIVFYCAHIPAIYLFAHIAKTIPDLTDIQRWGIITAGMFATTVALADTYKRTKILFELSPLISRPEGWMDHPGTSRVVGDNSRRSG